MTFELSKELMKFIFSVFVLSALVIGLVVIISSQISTSLDVSNIEMYNAYRTYKDNTKQDIYCVNKLNEAICKTANNCNNFGFIEKIEVCL